MGDDAPLVVGGRDRRRRRQVGERIPLPGDALVARQPLADEPVNRGGGQLQALAQMPQRRRSPECLQRLVHRAPLRRATKRPLPLQQRRQRAGERHDALDPLGGSRGPTHTPQRPGEQRAHRQPQGRAVVAADPAAQFQQRRRQGGLGVGGVGHRLQGAVRGSVVHAQHHADDAAALHGHDDARAHDGAGCERVGNEVAVGAGDRDGEEDLGDSSSIPAGVAHRRRTPRPGPVGRRMRPPSIVAPTNGSSTVRAAPSRSAASTSGVK